MNEAGPNLDLTTCEDVIQTAVQESSFSWRMQRPVDFYFATGWREGTNRKHYFRYTYNEGGISAFSHAILMASNGGLVATQTATYHAA